MKDLDAYRVIGETIDNNDEVDYSSIIDAAESLDEDVEAVLDAVFGEEDI
jgi:hypothetical protein